MIIAKRNIILDSDINDKEGKYYQKSYFSLEKISDGWKISHPKFGEFIFQDSLIHYRPDIPILAHGTTGYFLYWLTETYESKAAKGSINPRNGITYKQFPTNIERIATFWLGYDETYSSDIIFNEPVYLINQEEMGNVIVLEDKQDPLTTPELFKQYIPESIPFFTRIEAKQKLINQINELDSLAALEAQLDIITAFVLQNHPDSDISTALQGVTTLDLMDRSKLLETIRNQKQHLREIQQEYFNSRGECVNGKPSV